jgi:hypothetical protein
MSSLTSLQERIDAEFGRPSAAKRGRNPEWPYVPIIDYGHQEQGLARTRTHQIQGKAFKTRDEAVGYARQRIERAKAARLLQLAEPRHRAIRQHYGLPYEIDEATTRLLECYANGEYGFTPVSLVGAECMS